MLGESASEEGCDVARGPAAMVAIAMVDAGPLSDFITALLSGSTSAGLGG